MKNTLKLAGLALALTATFATAGGEGWMTDFEAAKKKAATENKDLLVDFTGSDWCSWCIKLNKEVFQHDAFKKGVKKDFILVELDYPRDKSKQSEAVQAQNTKLKDIYPVKGFPTILLMDAKGRPYAKTGYEAGGPENYLKNLKELQKNRTTRDAALAAADKLKGVEKAKALVAVLDDLPEEFVSNYSAIIADISKLDPEDKSGFAKRQKFKGLKKKLEAQISEAMQSGKADTAPALIDKFIVDEKVTGDEKNELLMTKLQIAIGSAMRSGKGDTAPALIDTFISENKPNAEATTELLSLKLQVEIGNAMKAKKFSEVPAMVDAAIAKSKLTGEDLQSTLGLKIGAYLQEQKFDEATKVLDAIIAVDADSQFAKQAKTFKPRLAKMKAEAKAKPATAPKGDKPAAEKKPANPPHGQPGHVHE